MSLRDEAITHMAQAVADERDPGDVWDSGHYTSAEAALDALLDFLDAHPLEWKREGGRMALERAERGIIGPENEAVSNFVAALRGTTKEQ